MGECSRSERMAGRSFKLLMEERKRLLLSLIVSGLVHGVVLLMAPAPLMFDSEATGRWIGRGHDPRSAVWVLSPPLVLPAGEEPSLEVASADSIDSADVAPLLRTSVQPERFRAGVEARPLPEISAPSPVSVAVSPPPVLSPDSVRPMPIPTEAEVDARSLGPMAQAVEVALVSVSPDTARPPQPIERAAPRPAAASADEGRAPVVSLASEAIDTFAPAPTLPNLPEASQSAAATADPTPVARAPVPEISSEVEPTYDVDTALPSLEVAAASQPQPQAQPQPPSTMQEARQETFDPAAVPVPDFLIEQTTLSPVPEIRDRPVVEEPEFVYDSPPLIWESAAVGEVEPEPARQTDDAPTEVAVVVEEPIGDTVAVVSMSETSETGDGAKVVREVETISSDRADAAGNEMQAAGASVLSEPSEPPAQGEAVSAVLAHTGSGSEATVTSTTQDEPREQMPNRSTGGVARAVVAIPEAVNTAQSGAADEPAPILPSPAASTELRITEATAPEPDREVIRMTAARAPVPDPPGPASVQEAAVPDAAVQGAAVAPIVASRSLMPSFAGIPVPVRTSAAEPEEIQEQGGEIEVAGRVQPQARLVVEPAYPSRARALGIEGVVHVEVDVDTEGVPQAVRVVRSSGRLDLDAAAEEASLRWRFHPAHVGNVKVPSSVVVSMEFRLSGGAVNRVVSP